jgi:hypothetical protein
VPVEQTSPVAQAWPHVPQFAALVDVFTHVPPHDVIPVGQAHAPLTHCIPPEHTVLHAPQLFGSIATSVQRVPQRRCPVGHIVVQVPPMQICPGMQALPHVPQFSGSVGEPHGASASAS